MAITKKHIKALTEDLTTCANNIEDYLESKLNEDNTRKLLIEEVLKSLGYSWDEWMDSETATGRSKSDRIDICLKTNGNRVEVLIECKRVTEKLDRHFKQLQGYFVDFKPTPKIGILTNGIKWEFYAPQSDSNKETLHHNPYFTFDLSEFTDTDVEQLIRYSRGEFDSKEIIEEAYEIYFLENFESALFKELSEPSDEFIKAVYKNMGGKSLRAKTRKSIEELINSKSLQTAVNSLIEEEIKTGGVVITTAEEINYYNIIKALILQARGMSKFTNRISYRDQKTRFNILVDDNNSKIICQIKTNTKGNVIIINDKQFDIAGIEDVVNLKKELIESAQAYLK